MAISFIFLILVALFVLGVVGAFVALIILAITKGGRGGAALVVGGLAFVGLLVGAALLFMWVGYSTVREQRPDIASVGGGRVESIHWQVGGESVVPPLTVTTDNAMWAIGLKSMIFVVIGIGAILVYATRHGHAHAAAAGHHRAWPLGLGLLVLGFFLIGGIRYQSSIRPSSEAPRARAVEQMRQLNLQQERQQQVLADQVAGMKANVEQQPKKTDIHEMMDQFDKPRIALRIPTSPQASSAELVAAETTPKKDEVGAAANENDSKSAAAVGAKSRSSSKQKRPKAATAATESLANSESNTAAEVPLPTPAKEATGSSKAVPESQKPEAAVRPSWVDATPVRTRDLRREVIVTEEYESMDECYRAADVYLMIKAFERVQQLRGQPYVTQTLPSITFRDNLMLADGQIVYVMDDGRWNDGRLSLISRMGITPEFLRNEIVSKDSGSDELHEYIENSTRSFGPMKRLHRQIEFTPAVDGELMRRWDAQLREDRFAYVGLGAGSVLGLLTMVWGLVKFDTVTRGYYTKRLFIGVPLGILGLFGIYAILVQSGVKLPH